MKKLISILGLMLVIAGVLFAYGISVSGATEAEQPAVTVSFVQAYAEPGKAFQVKLEGDAAKDCSVKWYVDGKSVGSGSSYTPVRSDLEKMITAKAIDKSGKVVASKTVLCSKLPVMYIDTEGGVAVTSKEDYINATLTVQGNEKYNSESKLYSGATEIKGRGNSTWLRFPKKPYRLKLDKKTDLLGLGKNKHWALLANYIDDSLVRNSLAGDIAGQLDLLKMDSAAVDVVFNGEHLGSYLLIEHVRISSDRVDLFDWEGVAEDAAKAIAKKHSLSEDAQDDLQDYMEKNMGWMTTKTVKFNNVEYKLNDYLDDPLPEFDGGFLIEMDEYMDEVSSFYSKNNTPLMVKVPEYVKTDETAYGYIQNYMNTFEDALYSADHTILQNGASISYTDIVDFDSLVAYWITSEMLVNEAGAKSTYVHKEIGQKLTFGPIWDFDYSSGGVSPWGSQPAEGWATLNRNWFKGVKKDPYFIVKVRETFLENEAYFDNLIAEDGTLDTWYNYLYESGVKNTALWNYSRGFEEDFNVLKSWMTRRIAFFKKMLATDKALAESFGVSFGGCNIDITADSVLDKFDGAYYVNADTVDKLTVSISNANAAGYNYYINSKLAGSGTFTDSKAEIVIDKSLLTEKAGTKNVIVVRLKDAEGKFTAVQMATVTVVPADTAFATLTLTDGEKTEVTKVPAGEKVYLGVSSACGKDNYFDGWVNGDKLYSEGSKITVSQNTTLTARYKLCKDSNAAHKFETNKDYDYTCSACGITKPTDAKYKDVASLSFKIYTHYQNKYTGKEVYPKLNIYNGSTKLKEGVHYTLTAVNNVNIGYATYTVKGLRSGGYDGATYISYMIIPAKMSGVSGGVDKTKTYVYNGSDVTPEFNITYKGIALVQGKDFYISKITGNNAPGTAKVTVTGMGNFTGSKTFSFTIEGTPVKDAKLTLSKTSYTYSGSRCKPAVTVKSADGKTTYSASDYTVSYKNNLNAGTATATVTFKGKYSGTFTKTFKINPASAEKYTATVKTAAYNGKAQTPSVTVKNSKGVKLVKGTDFTVKCTSKAKLPGKYNVTVTFKGNYKGTKKLTFSIVPAAPAKVSVSQTVTTITLKWSKVATADGYRVYKYNSKTKKYEKLKDVTKNTLKLKDLKAGTSYRFKVRAYTKNKDEGRIYGITSSAVITATKTKAPSITKIGSVSKNSAALIWTDVAGESGYQVYYSTKKDGTYKKADSYKAGTTKGGKKKLKSGKTYYFKVRAYKKTSGTTVYSAWSKVRSVKIK